MATIKQTISYIKSHPFYREALRDESLMEKLLFDIMFEVWQITAKNSVSAYRDTKRLNAPEIISALRDLEPPQNLDLRLPIPLVETEDECAVVPLKVVHTIQPIVYIKPKVQRHIRMPNPFQLIIEFTSYFETKKPQHLVEALEA